MYEILDALLFILVVFCGPSLGSGDSGLGSSASAVRTELAILRERAMADWGIEFLHEYSDNDIINNTTLHEFRSFLSRIPKSDPAIPLHSRASYPLDQYASFRRLVHHWPEHLLKLGTKLTGLALPENLLKLEPVFNAFKVHENGTFYNPNVTELDLRVMKGGIERIRFVHGTKPKDLTQHLREDEMPEISEPDIQQRKWTKEHAWRNEYYPSCNESVDSELKAWQRCFFDWKFVPYVRLKVELIWSDPWVAMYHDLFTETQGEAIINEAMSRMQVSTVVELDKDNHVGKVQHNLRLSMTAWLDPRYSEAVGKLYRDISFWSGLNTTVCPTNSSAEPLQVVNYGLGGMFLAHHDYFDDGNGTRTVTLPDYLTYSGERMMTWMLYFSEPILGGATVFPHLRQRVQPRKGSALVWENLKRDSSLEPLSFHGGCPVAIGQKWIGNVWIRDNGQVLTKRCRKS